MNAGDWVIVGSGLFLIGALGFFRLSQEADERDEALIRRINAGDDVRLRDVIRDTPHKAWGAEQRAECPGTRLVINTHDKGSM